MLVVLLIISIIIIIILIVGLYEKSTNAICLSRRRLEGKTVIVTGGTMGMGLVIATDLAYRGAKVIIACPFEDEGINARNRIIEETENKDVIFKLLDLGSLESTRKFAADILKTEERLDILINNAGVGFVNRGLTKDGLDFIMQVNYYGTFLLTILLLPLLKNSGKPGDPSRILTTSSCTHVLGQVDVDNLIGTSYLRRIRRYACSKIYLVYFAKELTKKLKHASVVVNNIDPGAVGTRIFDSLDIISGSFLTWACLILFKTPWLGAQTALHVALDKKAGEISGAYFKNCEIYWSVKRTNCEKTAKLIWDESVKRVKLSNNELDQCLS